ncbi:hypothetical protein AS026_38605 [Rhizobium altiplani]|uniref:Uncharacterized protein n=2 Tax=Rhizobium altiplani TaxID=1864509 RepID=A0A109JTJ0_9HYPH|nr:hypothetical protein AS026_38605 [Rhizobium altiplani]
MTIGVDAALVELRAKNPLLISPMLGTVVLVSGWQLPAPAHTFLKLLGGAAAPCALIALGLFLAGMQPNRKAERLSTVGILVGLKLVAQPAITWVIAGPVIGLTPIATHTAVLLAALPTGTGSFMLAEFYNRNAGLTGSGVDRLFDRHDFGVSGPYRQLGINSECCGSSL